MNEWTRRSGVDRLPGRRTDQDLDALWVDARLLEIDVRGSLRAADGRPLEAPASGTRRAGDILVGAFGGHIWFARAVPELADNQVVTWREVAAEWRQVTAAAVALVRWHASEPACERCGGPSTEDAGGSRRLCTRCGSQLFPRQDPAIIVAVLDTRERLLLGRQPSWAAGRFSLLAGFVEPGESLEQAVWREVAEEVGIDLLAVRYVSSQPWPLPRSLMFGFSARTLDEALVPDGVEIEEAEFIERADLLRRMERGQLSLPSSASIARQLIEAWLSESLPLPPV